MKPACMPVNEKERLDCLRRYAILDTRPEPAYDDLAQLAAAFCETPIALISLIDSERQWFKAAVGLNSGELHRDFAFCAHTLTLHDIMVVRDARLDERFSNNPMVTGEPYMRFYAGAPLISREGHVLGALCVIDTRPRTLTQPQQDALRRLSRQVVRLFEQRRKEVSLQRIREREEKFLRLISHDLKKPFNALLGFTSALQYVDDLQPDQLRQVARRIHGSAHSAYDLLRNLLLWSRFELGVIDFRPRWILFNDIFDNLLREKKAQADEKRIQFSNLCEESISVYADWQMLLAVLLNLTDNAIKYTPEGGWMAVDAHDHEQEVVIQVRDQGVGIARERLDSIFSLESEECTEGTAGERGTGLGILLCEDFMQRHQGRIWVESEPGRGTICSIAFPKPRLREV